MPREHNDRFKTYFFVKADLFGSYRSYDSEKHCISNKGTCIYSKRVCSAHWVNFKSVNRVSGFGASGVEHKVNRAFRADTNRDVQLERFY